MLFLNRKIDQAVVILLPDGRKIEVVLQEIRSDENGENRKAFIGINADRDIEVHRKEWLENHALDDQPRKGVQ